MTSEQLEMLPGTVRSRGSAARRRSDRRPPRPVASATGDLHRRTQVTVIEKRRGLQLLNWRELVGYRDLFRFLVWREIKVRYAQSAVGIGWAVIQPLVSVLIFTLVFGRLAKVSSDGAPYAVFSLTALVPWLFFSNAMNDGVSCLITNAGMLRKIYFPRMLMPLSAVTARLLDFAVASVVVVGVMVWYGIVPTWGILLLPALLALMVAGAAGAALWLTALAVQYRDVKHAMGFITQILMYAAPVVYPASLIPPRFQLLYAVNPMVGVIEGLRAVLLRTREIPWSLLGVGTVSAVLMLVSGMLYFRNRERLFSDVA